MSKQHRQEPGVPGRDEQAHRPQIASPLAYSNESRTFGYSVAAVGLIVVIIGLSLVLPEYGEEEHASVYTPVSELVIEDPVLRNCILDSARSNGWELSGQIQQLRCNNPDSEPVVSLEGINSLVNLVDANLAHNRLTDVSPLGHLSRLENLELGYNAIIAPELGGLRLSLRSLNLDHNQLDTLRWAQELESLESLSVGHNVLVDIDAISALRQLKVVNLEHNQLTDLGPLRELRSLEVLNLSGNAVKDIRALGDLENLLILDLESNRVSDVTPLASLARLYELNLANNPLLNIDPLGELVSLGQLNLSYTGISDFTALARLGRLETVDLSGTELSCGEYRSLVDVLGSDTIQHAISCNP